MARAVRAELDSVKDQWLNAGHAYEREKLWSRADALAQLALELDELGKQGKRKT